MGHKNGGDGDGRADEIVVREAVRALDRRPADGAALLTLLLDGSPQPGALQDEITRGRPPLPH